MAPRRQNAGERNRKDNTAVAVKINRDICEAANTGGAEAVLALCSKLTNLTLVNLSTALHRVACSSAKLADDVGNGRDQVAHKGAFDKDARLYELQQRTKAALFKMHAHPGRDSHARCLSTISWACAKLQLVDPEMMQVLCELSLKCIEAFKPLELSNLLWSMAKQRYEHRQLFQCACDHLHHSIDEYSPRSISMLAWAFATARFLPSRETLGHIMTSFLQRISEDSSDPNPVVIVNMVWALATIGVRGKREAISAIAEKASTMLGNFKHYELSITLWAFAKLGVFHETLFNLAAQRFCQDSQLKRTMHTQGLANSLWAFARFAQATPAPDASAPTPYHVRVLAELMPAYKRLLPQLLPLELSSILWAASILAGSYKQNSAADFIMVTAAENQFGAGTREFAKPLSLPGEVSVLGAYVRFFRGWQNQVPDSCSALIRRLLSHCSASGLDLGNESEVLASLPDLGAFANGFQDEEGADLESLGLSRAALQRIFRQASDDVPLEPPPGLSDTVAEASRSPYLYGGDARAAAIAAASTAGLVDVDKASFPEPAFVDSNFHIAPETVEDMPVYITDSVCAIDAWTKAAPKMCASAPDGTYIIIDPERCRCGGRASEDADAESAEVSIAFEAALASGYHGLVEVSQLTGDAERMLLCMQPLAGGAPAMRSVSAKPADGDWELHFSIKVGERLLTFLKLAFVGRLPRVLPAVASATKDAISARSKNFSSVATVSTTADEDSGLLSPRSISFYDGIVSGLSDSSDGEGTK
eukprot:TRINITY_DN23281_c0_g6_i1.p1 TRINITY_DN23281_c0_g6~~TRINITY_DN23281_c0_g6_i1.p1  ORF type:complete len:763 (-),score=163.52 TRINITY_DN23281_c0_g6_i1:211-2499(-)